MPQQALTRYQPRPAHDGFTMIDLLALAIPHFVMAIAVWRLVQRADLDDDPALPRPTVDRRKPGQDRQP